MKYIDINGFVFKKSLRDFSAICFLINDSPPIKPTLLSLHEAITLKDSYNKAQLKEVLIYGEYLHYLYLSRFKLKSYNAQEQV